MALREFSDVWATDLDKEPSKYGEIYDVDVINQSIELILGTSRGERLFIPQFGSGLPYRLFNTFTESEAEAILDLVIEDIQRWEDRITILQDESRIIVNLDNNYIVLIIPYIIKKRGIKSTFAKKIVT